MGFTVAPRVVTGQRIGHEQGIFILQQSALAYLRKALQRRFNFAQFVVRQCELAADIVMIRFHFQESTVMRNRLPVGLALHAQMPQIEMS